MIWSLLATAKKNGVGWPPDFTSAPASGRKPCWQCQLSSLLSPCDDRLSQFPCREVNCCVMENLEPSLTGASSSNGAANPGIPVKRKAVYLELGNDPPSAKRPRTEHYSNRGFCCAVSGS